MLIVGIDEVGRGCWAGPVVAGAVILRDPIEGLKDSKLLSKKQREKLTVQIQSEALAIGIGWIDAATVDTVGITMAVKLAMEAALQQIQVDYDQIIIDGNLNFLAENPKSQAIIKADTTIPAVSAASIVAKVARDNYMAEMALEHPDYGFERHVGYGTAFHLSQLKVHGVCELHRLTFKPVAALLQ
jgi:ribonuclease HII